MLLNQILSVYELLDSANASGEGVKAYLNSISGFGSVETYPLRGAKGSTDMIRILIPGTCGNSVGGEAPTIGLLGRLGGLGARPDRIGFVSDGDGALAVLGVAAKLLAMAKNGDRLDGDVFISTHICPGAPTQPHEPVPFMGSPVEIAQVNKEETGHQLDAILCCDTTKGNRIINKRGFAISPTVKDGYILTVSDSLLDLMEIVTGRLPSVFALTTQDITPYGNGLYHINSILQPATATHAPVVGVAITTESAVPGCATGASHIVDIEEAARFILETAKSFGRGQCSFYDKEEYARLIAIYGSMERLKTLGQADG
jgi:hypothetical protein